MSNKENICIATSSYILACQMKFYSAEASVDCATFKNGECIKNANLDKFDAIFIDDFLEDCSPLALIKELKKKNLKKNVRFISFSGFSLYDKNQKYLDNGFSHILQYPFNKPKFLLILHVLGLAKHIDEESYITNKSYDETLRIRSTNFIGSSFFKGETTISPVYEQSCLYGYYYPIFTEYLPIEFRTQAFVLNEIAKHNMLTTKTVDRVPLCKSCNSHHVHARQICPICQSIDISPTEAIKTLNEARNKEDFYCKSCKKQFSNICQQYYCKKCKSINNADELITLSIKEYSFTSTAEQFIRDTFEQDNQVLLELNKDKLYCFGMDFFKDAVSEMAEEAKNQQKKIYIVAVNASKMPLFLIRKSLTIANSLQIPSSIMAIDKDTNIYSVTIHIEEEAFAKKMEHFRQIIAKDIELNNYVINPFVTCIDPSCQENIFEKFQEDFFASPNYLR